MRARIVGLADPAQTRHGVADQGHDDHRVGTVEGQVAVGGGELRAVGVEVHRRQGVQEAPHASPKERGDRRALGPQSSGPIGMLPTALADHAEGEQHHGKERHRLQGGEDRTDPQPHLGRTDPEEVVTGADDAGNQRHGDDHVQPLLNHFAVHAGDLDQHERQHRAHDQFPHAFHPQVHHKPPVVLVARQVFRVVEGEQEEHRQTNQAGHHHQTDGGLAAFEQGHADVVEKAQSHHHNAHLGDGRLLKKLPPHGRQQVVAGHLGQARIGHKQIAQNGQHAGGGKYPEQDLRQQRAVQLAVGLLRDQVIGRAHKAEQQPDDQQVGVHHPRHVEGDQREQEVSHHVLQAHDQTEQHLAEKQDQGKHEVGFSHGLRGEFQMWICNSHLSALLVWRPLVGIDLRGPLEELGDVVHFLVAQMKLRHRAATRHAQRLDLHPGLQERLEAGILTATDKHIAQLGGEVRTLAQQGVAADAVVLLPDQLAAHHCLGHLCGIGALGKGLLGVVSQSQEYQEEEHAPPKVNIPGHALREGL